MRRQISEDEFASMFREFRRSAFRLEARDHYAPTYEADAFQSFLGGAPLPPDQLPWWQEWLGMISELAAQGKRIERVRVLAEPPSDYQRWELWGDPWHAGAGERIRYLPRSQAKRVGLPIDIDWWLFDEQQLVRMDFDGDGRPSGKTLVTGPETAARYCHWREVALQHAGTAEGISTASAEGAMCARRVNG